MVENNIYLVQFAGMEKIIPAGVALPSISREKTEEEKQPKYSLRICMLHNSNNRLLIIKKNKI